MKRMTLVSIGALVAAVSLAAATTASDRIAVLDFTGAGEPAPPEEWAYGLADLLAIELQQRGAALIERRDVRLLLRERALAGLQRARADWPADLDLPLVVYLVGGTIRQSGPDRFHLVVSLTDARTGREATSFDAVGGFPADIPAALAGAADRLGAASSLVPSRSAVSAPGGFSRTPEVSWLLYRGIEHCLADRPEWGAVFFIEAQRADRVFVAAKVWKLRAFEMLGLSTFAAVARQELAATPDGAEALACLDRGEWGTPDGLVVALVADPRLPEAGARQLAELRRALEPLPDIHLFDPDRIEGLAAEMDLQLTARFGEPTELTRLAWTAVHGIVGFEWIEATSAESAAQGRVTYRPALGARPVLTEEVTGGAAAMDSLAQQLAQRIRQRGPVASVAKAVARSTRVVQGADGRNPPFDGQRLPTRADVAEALRHLREHPDDREAWRSLPALRDWMDPYYVAIQDQLIAGVDPAEPHADVLLSEFLWARRGGRYGCPPATPTHVPLEEEFAPLLSQFPDSLAAGYVHVLMAMHALQRGDHATAAERLLELEQTLRQRAPADLISDEYWACFCSYTAAALRGCGRDSEALAYFRRADDLFGEHPDLQPYERVDGFWGREERGGFKLTWTNPFPATHELFGPERALREAVALALGKPPTEAQAGDEASRDAGRLEALEALFRRADEATGKPAVALHRERVTALIEYKRRHPGAFRSSVDPFGKPKPIRKVNYGRAQGMGPYTLEEKLVIEATHSLRQLINATLLADDFRDLQAQGRELADALDWSQAIDCLEAVGLNDEARQVVEHRLVETQPPFEGAWSSNPVPAFTYEERFRLTSEHRQLVFHTAGLRRRTGDPAGAAEFLRAEMRRLDSEPRVAAARFAADAWVEAGRPDLACDLFRDLAAQSWPTNDLLYDFPALLRFRWAECEMERGNLSEATELLRALAKESDGKSWHIDGSARTLLLKDNVLNRLLLARVLARVRLQSRDWEHAATRPNPLFPLPARTATSPASPADRELQDILIECAFLPACSGSNPSIESFVARHGHDGLPAVLRAAERNVQVGAFLLLRFAEPADAPKVLDFFKRHPGFAEVAFKLDAVGAAQILRERFGIFAKGQLIPWALWRLVRTHRLHDQYPVLLANLLGDAWNAHVDVPMMDRILEGDPDPELDAQFRDILAYRLELHFATDRGECPESIARVAVKRGVRQGIGALVHRTEPDRAAVVAFLRNHLDLPADEARAWQLLETGPGRWEWDEQRHRFVPAAP